MKGAFRTVAVKLILKGIDLHSRRIKGGGGTSSRKIMAGSKTTFEKLLEEMRRFSQLLINRVLREMKKKKKNRKPKQGSQG